MNFCGNLFLARYLSINDYGFYGIVFFIFSFILNFGDIGLGASLIYQKEQPSFKDKHTIFSVQLLLSVILAGLLSLSAGYICGFYKIPKEYSIFFHFISVTLVILSFKTIPTLDLERNIEFGWLSVVEIIQAFFYNGIAIFLAYKNWGPYSFCGALLIRTFFGAILVNLVRPGTLGLKIDFQIIKKHLKFGLPYQLSLFINVLKDSFSPVIIGSILGMEFTGIVNMASLVASFPTMLLFVLSRLFFPAFSRVKDNMEELRFLFKTGIIFSNAIAALISVYLLINCKSVIIHVFGEKWLTSQMLSYFFWTANLTLPSFLVCSSMINALGKPKFILKFNILAVLINLIIGIPLVLTLGIYGAGVSNVIVNILMLLILLKTQLLIKCNVYKEIIICWLAVIPSVLFIQIFKMNRDFNLDELILYSLPYTCIYVGTLFIFIKDWLLPIIKMVKAKTFANALNS